MFPPPFHKATCVSDDISKGTDNNLTDFLICFLINISLSLFSTSLLFAMVAIRSQDSSSERPGGHCAPCSPYAHTLCVCFWVWASFRRTEQWRMGEAEEAIYCNSPLTWPNSKNLRAGCSLCNWKGPVHVTAAWVDGRSRLLSYNSSRKKWVFSTGVKQVMGKAHAKGFANNKAADLKLDKLRVEKSRLFVSAEQRLLWAGTETPQGKFQKEFRLKPSCRVKIPHYHTLPSSWGEKAYARSAIPTFPVKPSPVTSAGCWVSPVLLAQYLKPGPRGIFGLWGVLLWWFYFKASKIIFF